jgi:hypothetical protein
MQSLTIHGPDKANSDDIADAEQRIGQPIPPRYRAFLAEHNGGRPEPSEFTMAGGRKGSTEIGSVKSFLAVNGPEETLELEYVFNTFRDRIPAGFFPVARDPGGNLICIATEEPRVGEVYFWDHERESDEGEPATEVNVHFIADSFDAFLDSLGET